VSSYLRKAFLLGLCNRKKGYASRYCGALQKAPGKRTCVKLTADSFGRMEAEMATGHRRLPARDL